MRPPCRSAAFVVLALLGLSAAGPGCGRVRERPPEKDARRIEDPDELDELDELEAAEAARAPSTPPKWRREPPPMPETFAAFTAPKLSALDGAWLVASEIPGRRELWIVEEDGAKLTQIDHQGRERVYGLTLASPCSLRLTDERGHARTRVLALDGESLVVGHRGATAVAGSDGSMLACVGHRTYQIAADGRCRYTTEMLGSWSELADPEHGCVFGQDAGERTLRIADQILRERDGLWLDDLARAALARREADRDAGLAALAGPPAPAPAPGETGGETGGEIGGQTSGETGGQTSGETGGD